MPNDILRLLAMVGTVVAVALGAPGDLTLRLTDYAVLPITGALDGTTNNTGSLARINFMRQEPSARDESTARSGQGPSARNARPSPGGGRIFVNDLNGPLYILGADKKPIRYLDFNGR